MNTVQGFRIAVVGGGIGGLALALALSQANENSVSVDIYEAATEISEIGAGVALLPRTWEILKNLGVDGALSKHLTPDMSHQIVFQFRKSDQPDGVPIQELTMKGGISTFHRADVQQVLLRHLGPACKTHFSRRLASYTESRDSVRIQFEDGSTASCDLLVGADGLRSTTRQTFLGGLSQSLPDYAESIDPIWSGSVAYRALVSSEMVARHAPGHRALTTPVMYCGKNKHIVVYPISQGRSINLVAFVSQPSREGTIFPGAMVVDASREELESIYSHWEEEVQVLIKCVEKALRWAIYSLVPLGVYAKGRVALLGDAAHGMTTHQGAGAGQAIEDAYILSTIIQNVVTNKAPVSRITEVYNTIRQPFGNRILNASRYQGMLYELSIPGCEDIQEGDSTVSLTRLSDLFADLKERWKWAWNTSEDDRGRALAML